MVEDVHHHVAEIDEHPAPIARAFPPQGTAPARGHGLAHAVGDGVDLAIAPAADHDDEIRVAGPAADVDEHGLDGLLVERRGDGGLGRGERFATIALVGGAQGGKAEPCRRPGEGLDLAFGFLCLCPPLARGFLAAATGLPSCGVWRSAWGASFSSRRLMLAKRDGAPQSARKFLIGKEP